MGSIDDEDSSNLCRNTLQVRLGIRDVQLVHVVCDLSPLALGVASRGKGLLIDCDVRHGELVNWGRRCMIWIECNCEVRNEIATRKNAS